MKAAHPIRIGSLDIPVYRCGVLVIGSGAASLATAERLSALARGPDAEPGADDCIACDTVIATEDLQGGTSRNTGSDKQTYYRLSMSDLEGDSPYAMAEALWGGGAVHGDIALAEALGSAEAFFRLVSLGVPFPMNEYGAFVGYKTDHDPRRRGTSMGPYTSKVMVERLIAEIHRRNVPILDRHHAVALLATDPADGVGNKRILGAVFIDEAGLEGTQYGLKIIVADAVVFGTGGPGGLYESSVYPTVHSGAIGLAIEIGAACVNLTESQFGLASTGFRWNVSGTYQQVVPRYFSVDSNGTEEEFLTPFFPTPAARDSAVFLKGYQWPFDPRKVAEGGSSLVDLLVHRERSVRGRRVYMDFRRNPECWNPELLSPEAREYLMRSGAVGGTPLDRLAIMNPPALELYAKHGIDLASEPLEISVCAQHNNGGLAADAWWESTTIDRFFPVGEVNGSHGIYRFVGAALNAGQVGAQRAARRIVGAYRTAELQEQDWTGAAYVGASKILAVIADSLQPDRDGVAPAAYRHEYRSRMDEAGGIIRAADRAGAVAADALDQVGRFNTISIRSSSAIPALLRDRHLVLAHAAYLACIAAYADAGGGSRGSSLMTGKDGISLHPSLDPDWNALEDRPDLREYLERLVHHQGRFEITWEPRRPIPQPDDWFENVWRAFREGAIYRRRTP